MASQEGASPVSKLPWKEACDQIHGADKDLLDSGYMSDCTVICGDSKWTTHKTILCSRNKWFRAALSGGFNEASTGVVTIQDTNPAVVKAVLHTIYTAVPYCYSFTPVAIVETWKAGDFFGIHSLCLAAENTMFWRLKKSSDLLNFASKKNPWKNRGCMNMTAVHELCGHFVLEDRACPVNSSQGHTLLRVCEPEFLAFRDSVCDLCEKRIRNERLSWTGPDRLRDAADQLSQRHSPPTGILRPNDETRERIESELRDLCEALNLALADTPEGSPMHKELINHVCNTSVAAWGGFMVCRFLENESSAA